MTLSCWGRFASSSIPPPVTLWSSCLTLARSLPPSCFTIWSKLIKFVSSTFGCCSYAALLTFEVFWTTCACVGVNLNWWPLLAFSNFCFSSLYLSSWGFFTGCCCDPDFSILSSKLDSLLTSMPNCLSISCSSSKREVTTETPLLIGSGCFCSSI